MNQIIKGDDLMVFDAQGKSIALATAHTLSLSADSTAINTKDHGIWGSTEVNKINWEISTDNLFSTTEFDGLFDKMIARTPVTVYFGHKSETGTGDVDTDGTGTTGQKTWTKSNTGMYTGQVLVTSLTANANSGDNATFSATFTGVGDITRTA